MVSSRAFKWPLQQAHPDDTSGLHIQIDNTGGGLNRRHRLVTGVSELVKASCSAVLLTCHLRSIYNESNCLIWTLTAHTIVAYDLALHEPYVTACWGDKSVFTFRMKQRISFTYVQIQTANETNLV